MIRFRSPRGVPIIAGLALAAALVSGCTQAKTPGPAEPEPVLIDNFNFTPPTITVAAGATVTWTNRDDVPHTVTANDRQFASGALDTDDHYSHRFTAPGTYAYFCAVHPHMTGQVIVK
jgi:plastocyanin